jgi:hypothetical protein
MSEDLNPKYKQSRQFSVETSDGPMLAFGAFTLKIVEMHVLASLYVSVSISTEALIFISDSISFI